MQMHVVAETRTVVGREAVVRTSMGDIRARLFADECPKVRPMPCNLNLQQSRFWRQTTWISSGILFKVYSLTSDKSRSRTYTVDPNEPLVYVEDLCRTGLNQETCPRSRRLYGSHPAT